MRIGKNSGESGSILLPRKEQFVKQNYGLSFSQIGIGISCYSVKSSRSEC